jgi:hypothetical protein
MERPTSAWGALKRATGHARGKNLPPEGRPEMVRNWQSDGRCVR